MLRPGREVPLLALAPMQEVTDWPFWNLMRRYGGPDVYVTEYFRVSPGSHLSRYILRSVTENPTGRPVIAQFIGNSIPDLTRLSRLLQDEYPVAGIDLNLGCPAPVVYKKCAGGGLLREPHRVDAILGAMRQAITDIPFTVKTRIGFDDPAVFEALLPIFAKHQIDLLSVHGRTVAEGYRSEVHYDYIARAAEVLPCPVLANGGISTVTDAAAVMRQTRAHGLMLGRGAIRNPWLFDQIRQCYRNEPTFAPTGRDVLNYIQALYDEITDPAAPEKGRVTRMKKYLIYIAVGVSPEFLHDIRRAQDHDTFFTICREHLDHEQPVALEPEGMDVK